MESDATLLARLHTKDMNSSRRHNRTTGKNGTECFVTMYVVSYVGEENFVQRSAQRLIGSPDIYGHEEHARL
jgi:acetylornithine/succinyldiaminopimelate/putrescine aminotransferase